MKEFTAIAETLATFASDGATLATLVRVEGSSYRRPGARLLLLPDGRRIGSISGGCLEEDVLTRAKRVAASKRAETVIYDTTAENDLVWGVGLGCHGVVRVLIEPLFPKPNWALTALENAAKRQSTSLVVRYGDAHRPTELGTQVAHAASDSASAGVFVEPIAPPLKLCIFGAGDDALPLARFGKELGWMVCVADPRSAFATRARFPDANLVEVGPPEQLVEALSPDAHSVAVVMTHHYVHDLPILGALLRRRLPYLGLLGPRKRAEKILADLAVEGVRPSPDQAQRLFAPIGLDLGADGAEQVALSIVAEIQAVLNGRNAGSLRDRRRPIHEGL